MLTIAAPAAMLARVDSAHGETGRRRSTAFGADEITTPPDEARRSVESQLGVDLAGVRVHRGPQTARAADEYGARAFTSTRDDVHLPAREGALTADPARQVLVHELTHVAQRRLADLSAGLGADTGLLSDTGRVADLERQADVVAGRAPSAAGVTSQQPHAQPAGVQRWSDNATASGTSQPQGSDHAEIEALARRLYEPLRARLRAEASVDRERFGTLLADME